MKKYNAEEIEKKWREYWKKEKIYRFDPKSKKKIYSIDTPPPYISGKMHIGHAFSYSQQDFIIRFRRMKGYNIFYPFGTDDNGLPTEKFVEKLNNVESRNMGRAEFIELSLKTLKKVTPDCIKDFINLGISSDYDLYYSTIDRHSQKISQKSFIELAKAGEIYQKDFPTIWCPECQTSISQAELEDKEEKTLFSTLKFRADKGELNIATTRPELLGACVAVFVNPEDKRYKKFIGEQVEVPLFNYKVPVIADKSAEMEKGTGALMICSYGDKFDVDAVIRHKLSPRIILNKDGTLNIKNYNGLKIKAARKKILEDLKKAGLIKEQKEIIHAVNVHDKCGACIEFLPTLQWFIRIIDKKKKWIKLGREIKWHPEFMRKRYENWVQGLEWDWSISRNRHFGVPIPAWTCSCSGKQKIIFPDEKELPADPLKTEKICPECRKPAVPEKMVLDTWATSSLTPQISAELPQAKGLIKIPLSLRPQGHDIIRTWAFYTIVKSYFHENNIPWKNIIISGNVSLGGEKMSKSKGNVIEPQKVLKKYGADALRFWAAGSKLGEDMDYSEKDIVTGKKFATKIFNASKFVFMNLKKKKISRLKKLEEADRLLLIKLNSVIKSATESFEKYEYSRCKNEVVNFFWKDFCDNYLELVKRRVYNGTEKEKESAFYTLYNSLFAILKMMAPITPFIAEEIYQNYFKRQEKKKSIHICSWPELFEVLKKEKDSEIYELLLKTIGRVRQEKSKANKSVKAEIILYLEKNTQQKLNSVLGDLKDVVNAKKINEGRFKVEFD